MAAAAGVASEAANYNSSPDVKIYTKTGDAGETSLFDGTRVAKTDPRVVAFGDVDELHACLGLAAASGLDAELNGIVLHLQRDLFALGARLADPSHRIAPRVTKIVIDEASVAGVEQWIDQLEAGLPPLRHFILAGGGVAGATLHLARTICRRAERSVLLLGADNVDSVVRIYLNRLSDLLFVMARAANHRIGIAETKW